MYNFALAFVLCAVAYLIGDAVSILTKAWVPSVFVTAIVLLIGYWTVLPAELISDSKLIPFGSTIGIYLLITHMGTIISLKQLGEQWKTIVVCLAGLAGMCLACWLVCIPIIGREFVVAGLPPLTGGIVAAVAFTLYFAVGRQSSTTLLFNVVFGALATGILFLPFLPGNYTVALNIFAATGWKLVMLSLFYLVVITTTERACSRPSRSPTCCRDWDCSSASISRSCST